MESIDSPEIPDRRGTSDIPGLTSRDSRQKEGKPEREIGLGRRTREEIGAGEEGIRVNARYITSTRRRL